MTTDTGNPADIEHPIKAGRLLRQAREARSLSLEQVAQATRIRVHYLSALEAGDFDALPSLAQARGFVRAYAGYLGLDGEALLNVPDSHSSAGAAAVERAEPPQPEKPPDAKKPAPAEPILSPEPEPAKEADAAPSTAQSIPPPDTTEHLPPTPPSSPAPISGDWEQAKPVFIEIGQRLKRQRELLGLSLDDIERHTHLRQHYLKSLEAGDLEGLPSPVQGRGMLNNYATFLGLDPEPLLLRFADGLQTRLAAKKSASPPQPKPDSNYAARKPLLPAPLRRIFSGDLLIGFILAAFLIAFIVWGSIRIFALQGEQLSTPTAPSIADVLLASPTPTPLSTPVPATPTSPLPPALQPQVVGTDALTGDLLPAGAPGKVQIYISVRQRAWMRVLVDGEIEFEGRVLPGSAYTFIGNSQVEILTGNGAALQVYFGQSDLGQMGTFGQVVDHIYTAQGIVNPTPTITPTGLATIPATSTPAATLPPASATAPPLP